ncbi:aerobic respiration control sensor protein arcB [Melanomma pulvis-pyrius CBS 109.77]|uniref:Aerobic respiration control sensor protein arcB n=1 Tax=Melanomma pulvis-pyrius CBS 109.77 TaxID=1314802 RepID=A0A6A6X1N7_9PLEO|nr:aerobic respiration control sensor protein arcB [Melanomma pulvis-pyrius CBS 109.77]
METVEEGDNTQSRDVSQDPPDSSAVRPTDAKEELEKDALNELDSISLKEILDQDSRPTFILDLDSDYVGFDSRKDDIRPIFCNSALRLHDRLLDSITGVATEQTSQGSDATYDEFRSWATGATKFDDSRDVFPLTLVYQGMLWTGSTIRQRWRMISGNQCYQISDVPKGNLFTSSELAVDGNACPSNRASKEDLGSQISSLQPPRPTASENAPTVQSKDASYTTLVSSARLSKQRSSKVSDGKSNDTSSTNVSITFASPEHVVPDWTVAKPKGVLSEHLLFTRAVDWAATPLGPMSSWSAAFREIANLVMRNPHPAALFWGEELTMFYNEAYRTEVAGSKHPELMGTGFSGPFSEMWDNVGPVFRECALTGNSVRRENDRLPIERFGYIEETFFSWSFTPLYGGTGRILGFYNAPFETTFQTISSRRMQTLRYLGENIALARSTKHFWKCVLDGLEDNHYDVPFALLYSVVDSDDADTASHSSDSTISLKSCVLEGSIGIPNGHPASPPRLDLKRSKEGFIPAFREAMRTREPTTLHTRDGTLPEALLEGIEWRGVGDPCREAIIIPVRPTNGENIFAFLLIGINPRRAYDEDYRAFSAMLNRQLATSLASVLLFEEEVRRSQNAAELAALEREQLSQELELQASRMKRMTELSPLGMYLFSPEGVLLEANDRYYEMTGHPRDSADSLSFLDHMAEGSRQRAKDMWTHIITDLKPRSEELQLSNSKVQPRNLTSDEPIEYWVLASSMPEIGLNGELRSIMGSIADISHLKWAQGLQDRRLREAEETKRQQNEFIDITSHEMRNPLGAILICADDIRDSLRHHHFNEDDVTVVEDCIEAANNIALCVQHQKSIVDDILTVSKLDSNLLLITPVPTQPVAVIQRAMAMFKPEVQAKDIQFNFCPGASLEELGIDWVYLDPSRLIQIIINLITNAIKFTAMSPKRVISVHIGASTEPLDLHGNGFEYVPTRGSLVNITAGEEWGNGELLYIQVQVEDTGCGLTVEEKQLLFERFAQASPRTHAHYGGSGLGLFISRQLAELHGGQIGVSSEADVGSTFGFFIQARRILKYKRPPLSRQASTQMPAIAEARADLTASRVATVLASHLHPLKPKPKLIDPTHYAHLHVLIVEDNLLNQKLLSKQITKAGGTVSTADNGLLALAHLETTWFQKPDGVPLSIILMDLEMPEMDGLTCVGCIRKMEAEGVIQRHVPVIAVTANVRGEQIAMARDSGMDDVVSKPFRVPELLAKIEALLSKLEEGKGS